jgi:hypothetical protein
MEEFSMVSKRVFLFATMVALVTATAFAAPTLEVGTLQMVVDGSGNALGLADLNNNPALITAVQTSTVGVNGPWTAAPDNTAAIGRYLAQGYNFGDWLGTVGITSGNAQANAGVIGLGFASGADYTSYLTDFYGVVPAPTATVIKYTYVGDSNLDGVVDINDMLSFLGNYDPSGTVPGSYFQGDTNFDSIIDITDMLNLLGNYPTEDPVLSGGSMKSIQSSQSVVPEPATITMLLVAGIIALVAKKRFI